MSSLPEFSFKSNPLMFEADYERTVSKLRLVTSRCNPVPLNACDKLSHQIPIIQLIEHLFQFYDWYDIAWLEFLAQVFIKSTSFTRHDKIIALELIGALLNMEYPFTFVIGYSVYPCELGLKCWREAMKLRYFPAEGEPLLPKIPFVPIPSVASSLVFGCAVEVLYMEGLDLLEGHFKRNFFTLRVQRTCKKFMQRQALLVIRRITSQSNSEHPSSLYLKSLLKFGTDSVADNQWNLGYSGENQLITNTFLLIMEHINGFDPKKITSTSFNVIISTLHKMSLYFFKMIRQPSDSPGSKEPTYANLLVPTRFFDTIANVFPEPAIISSLFDEYGFCMKRFYLAELVFRFVYLLDSISPRLSSQEKQHLDDCYSNYIRHFFPERTTTVLHAAVRKPMPWILWNEFRVTTIENLKTTIKHLLKLGANPNAIDGYGRTPLHIFAGKEKIHLDENVALFQVLVDAGTHLGMAANNGETVLSILKKNLMRSDESSLIVHPFYESLLSTDVFPLSCFCARVIRHHEIQFDRLPLHLQTFVTRYSVKKGPNDLTQADD